MKRIIPSRATALPALLVLVATAACSGSEAAPASGERAEVEAGPAPRPTAPVGSLLTFRVDEEVSTRTHRAGDTFHSVLVEDVVGLEGRVVVPAGSTGIWTVAESIENDGEGGALLRLALEALLVRGERRSVTASVVEAELLTDGADSRKETAAKIGIGAAAGAIAGRILGSDGGDALKGALAGAALGSVVALSTRTGSATLTAGSRLVARLDQPLVLEAR